MSHRRVAVASVCILAMTLAGTSGCTPMTTVTAVGYPTPSAAPRVTNSPFAIGNGRVFVVTPAYLQVVAPTLADHADKIDEGYAEAVDSGRAVIPEYATVASAFERHLLDAGLQPIAEDTLTSALSDEAVSARFDALAREQGAVTLLQLAMEVGPRIDASLALLVRSSRLGYTDRPIVYFPGPARCEPLRIQPLEALLDVALVATDTGDILWSGEMTLRASDLLPEPVTFPRGPHRAQFTHQYSPTFIIYGQDDGTRCGTTSIGGFFCMEWGANSGGCLTVAPAFPEVNAYMVDETVRRLVEIMTPLAHVAEQGAPRAAGYGCAVSHTSEFEGQHVVVTGGTGALGRSVVGALLTRGAQVHIPVMFPRELEGFPYVKQVHAVEGVDLRDEASCAAFFGSVEGPLYASIHLAGGFSMAPIEDTSVADYQKLVDLNLTTCFLSCREAVRCMSGEGRIVNVAAKPALVPTGGLVAYSLTKAAVAGLTLSLAEEVRERGIWVNAVVPSTMNTPANVASMPDADHGAWPTTDDVAATIAFLASPSNRSTRGALVPVYGRT